MGSSEINIEEGLDRIFNELENSETQYDKQRFSETFDAHQTTYEGTPLNFIKNFLAWASPDPGQIIYDLGCGFGRVIIYGALNSEAIFKGIELVPERANIAETIRAKLELENARFYCGDAAKFDFSDGDIFFLFNPFSPEVLQLVGEKLRQLAQTKRIKVATWGGSSNDFFNGQDWLRKSQNHQTLLGKLEFFESI